jgi:hypothetical protein
MPESSVHGHGFRSLGTAQDTVDAFPGPNSFYDSGGWRRAQPCLFSPLALQCYPFCTSGKGMPMAVVPLVEREDAAPEARASYDDIEANFGVVRA